MADTFTLLRLGDATEAERIMDAFEAATGLSYEVRSDGRSFAVHGAEHAIHVIDVLNGIDEHWERHLALAMPT
jgi:hypothetical protein